MTVEPWNCPHPHTHTTTESGRCEKPGCGCEAVRVEICTRCGATLEVFHG